MEMARPEGPKSKAWGLREVGVFGEEMFPSPPAMRPGIRAKALAI